MTAKIYISAKERDEDLLNPIVQRIHEIYDDPKITELKIILTGVAAFNNDSALTLHYILTQERPEHLTISVNSYCTMALPEMGLICAGDRRWVRPDAKIRMAVKYPSKYFSGEPDDAQKEKAEDYRLNPGFLDQELLLDIVNQWIEVKALANQFFTGRDLATWGVLNGVGLDAELEALGNAFKN
jgi:hypothetical protein